MSDEKYLIIHSTGPVFDAAVVGVQEAVGSLAVATLGDKKAGEFAGEVVALVRNKEFLAELGQKVGSPTETETEEQFVLRAKQAMRTLLKSKLK